MISGKPPIRLSIKRSFNFADDHQARARALLLAGFILSFVGYMLPWFKFDSDSEWWYGGWEFITTDGLGGLWMVAALYVVLAIAILVRATPGGLVLTLAVAVILATMVMVSIAAGDALREVRTIERLVWSIGLPIMLPGHGVLLWGAIYRAIIPVIDEAMTYLEIDVNDKPPL